MCLCDSTFSLCQDRSEDLRWNWSCRQASREKHKRAFPKASARKHLGIWSDPRLLSHAAFSPFGLLLSLARTEAEKLHIYWTATIMKVLALGIKAWYCISIHVLCKLTLLQKENGLGIKEFHFVQLLLDGFCYKVYSFLSFFMFSCILISASFQGGLACFSSFLIVWKCLV